MNTPAFDRIQEVFAAANKLSAAERSVFLDQIGSDDPDLKREVETLLKFAAESDLVVTVPGDRKHETTARVAECSPGVPARIGRYVITSEIGRGGQATV